MQMISWLGKKLLEQASDEALLSSDWAISNLPQI
jgi:hypothetical protein